MPATGYVATTLGIVFSLIVGFVLMALFVLFGAATVTTKRTGRRTKGTCRLRVLRSPRRLFNFPAAFADGFRHTEAPMTRTIRLQSDSNAHDPPWRVAVEQGFFAAEGLNVEYFEDNPKGPPGRVQDFAQRWKESQLQKGALEVYPVCEWGAIERVQSLGGGKIIGLDTTVADHRADGW